MNLFLEGLGEEKESALTMASLITSITSSPKTGLETLLRAVTSSQTKSVTDWRPAIVTLVTRSAIPCKHAGLRASQI
jgi:hypothetical protein